MDSIDEMMLNQIGDIKFWSGIAAINKRYKPEWPTRMIFRFSISAKACYEIICKSIVIDPKTLEPDIFEPNAKYILYYTDLALWHDGVSRFNREIITEGNLETCLKFAKKDFNDSLFNYKFNP